MTSVSRCFDCGFRTPDRCVCKAISCPTFIIREFGEILDFNGFMKFSPKIGSNLQQIVFYDKTYAEVEAFLKPLLEPLLKRK